MDSIKATNDFVDIHYQQNGKSTNTDAMGMRDKDRDSALMQVLNTTYENGVVQFHLGTILEALTNK